MYRLFAGVLILCVVLPVRAEQYAVTFGGEYFNWREYSGSSKLVDEQGMRQFIGLSAESRAPDDWVYEFRSRIYVGEVAYDGQTQSGTPHSTVTDYRGWAAELDFTRQLSDFRTSEHQWGVSFSLGYDSWLRSLRDRNGVMGYDENYQVGYGRLGGVYSDNSGWSLRGGVKLPFYTDETVGLTRLGFDSDPTLKPRPDYSLYATFAYELGPKWSIVGYYDSYRFKQSAGVQVPAGGLLYRVWQPDSQQDTIGLHLNMRF